MEIFLFNIKIDYNKHSINNDNNHYLYRNNLMTTQHIFIDGSYFIFYRTFALINWWRISHKEEPYDNLHLNDEFVNKFKQTFITKIQEIPKKLNIALETKVQYYIGKDCPQSTIWRKELYNDYKGSRLSYKDSPNNPAEFFKIVYDENNNLFQQALPNAVILEYPRLEADDCIALYSRDVLETEPYDEIIIMTSDFDYLQLVQQRVNIYDLKYNLLNNKMTFECRREELLYKIILGDKSDNIPSVFPKCGKKTAINLCSDISLFETRLMKDEKYLSQYKLNKRLIDFNEIPKELKNEFLNRYGKV